MTKWLQPVVITTNSSFGLLNSLKKRFPESSVRVIDAGKNVVMWLNLWLQRLNAIAKFSNLFTCCIYCVLNRWLSPFALSYLSWSMSLLECLGLFFSNYKFVSRKEKQCFQWKPSDVKSSFVQCWCWRWAVLPFADQTFRFRFYSFSGIKFLMGTAMEEVLKPATFSFSQSSILYTQSQWWVSIQIIAGVKRGPQS